MSDNRIRTENFENPNDYFASIAGAVSEAEGSQAAPEESVAEPTQEVEEVVESVVEITDEPVEPSEEPTETSEETTEPVIEEPVAAEESASISEEEDIYAELYEEQSSEQDRQPIINEVVSSLSNELGVEATDVNGIIEAVKNRVETAESSVDEWKNGIPDELIQAVELAKSGGDYHSYLNVSSHDYDSVSDLDLVASTLTQHFVNPDGTLDQDRLNKYVDDMTDDQIRVEGAKIRQHFKSSQEAAMQSKIDQANEKKSDFVKGIDKSLSEFNDVNGYKVSVGEKAFIKNAVADDTLMKELFFDKNGNWDFEKVIGTVFKARNFDKMQNHLASKIRNTTKREVIGKMSNVEKRTTSTPPEANPVDKTTVGYQQDAWIQSLREKAGL